MTLLESSTDITIGKHTYYNGTIKLVASALSPIQIGSYCAIGNNLKIITLNHDYNFPAVQGTIYRLFLNQNHPGETSLNPTIERTKGGVTIGNDVWIGDDVTILSGVTIGDGCCIGTKSLVTTSIPPYSIVGGVPCKILKMRYSTDMIKLLLSIKWWDWSAEKIKNNKQFFNTNINSVETEYVKRIIK